MVKCSSRRFGFVVKVTELRGVAKKSDYRVFCEPLVGTAAEKANPFL